MSEYKDNETFMPRMTIIGGEKPFQRFIGPDREAERRSLHGKHISIPNLEYSMTYFVRTYADEINMCYFDEARLTFMLFEYPFYKRYWHTIPERCVAAYQDVWYVTSLLKRQGRLPVERLTVIEEPRIPVSKPKSKDEVRYGDPRYVIVMGRFSYHFHGEEKSHVFPCVYLGNGRWHNNCLIEPYAYLPPEAWCYFEDLLFPSEQSEPST